MIYEIINPSDKITLEADALDVARAACLALGKGHYGLTEAAGPRVLPIFLLGGYDDWARENNFDLGAVLAENGPEVAAALESCAVISAGQRAALVAATNGDPAALGRWNEQRRSSMNDICGCAKQLAAALRARASEAAKP